MPSTLNKQKTPLIPNFFIILMVLQQTSKVRGTLTSMTPFHTVYIQENFKTSLKVIDKIISVHSCQVASRCLEQLTKISQSLALSGSTLILLHDGILRTGSTRTLNDINKTEKLIPSAGHNNDHKFLNSCQPDKNFMERVTQQAEEAANIQDLDSPLLTPLLVTNAARGENFCKNFT